MQMGRIPDDNCGKLKNSKA